MVTGLWLLHDESIGSHHWAIQGTHLQLQPSMTMPSQTGASQPTAEQRFCCRVSIHSCSRTYPIGMGIWTVCIWGTGIATRELEGTGMGKYGKILIPLNRFHYYYWNICAFSSLENGQGVWRCAILIRPLHSDSDTLQWIIEFSALHLHWLPLTMLSAQQQEVIVGLCSVLRPRQHSIGYMGDGFCSKRWTSLPELTKSVNSLLFL